MNIKTKLIGVGTAIAGFVTAIPVFAAELSTSTINTIVTDNVAQLKQVAGDNLPVIFLVAALIALAFVAFRWFRRMTGIRR